MNQMVEQQLAYLDREIASMDTFLAAWDAIVPEAWEKKNHIRIRATMVEKRRDTIAMRARQVLLYEKAQKATKGS